MAHPHLLTEKAHKRIENGNGRVFQQKYVNGATTHWDALHNKTLKIKVMREDGRLYVLGFEQNGKMHIVVEGR